MSKVGYYLSTEEYSPGELVEQAQLAEKAGFEALWISDHFHPWNNAQGQSPFVWSVLGALSQRTHLPIVVAVTCPIMRIHPVIIAQAASTTSVMLGGRFTLGVGTGENLNEHVVAQRWPGATVRLEMLEEAVELMRELWTGQQVTWQGTYFRVDRARIYTRLEQPPPIYVSGFGAKSTQLAGRIGDGYIQTSPNADMAQQFKTASNGKPAVMGTKVCWAPTQGQAVELAHRLWATSGVPGELSQELPTPAHFEQAATLVTPEQTAAALPCGPDPEPIIQQLEDGFSAGFDEVYVTNIGPHWREMIAVMEADVLPHFSHS